MSNRYPFPAYANGWFRVAYADELAVGQVRPLHYFGRELVLYRDEAGAAHVLDAHCPHLGAHLGHGGRVEGSGVRCPFHAWLWSGDGRCIDIPYAKRIPPKAKIRAWPVTERNGLVLLWHHAEGRAPSWEIPEIPELSSEEWTPLQVRKWTVRARWLDMNENAVDQAHFVSVHGTKTQPQTQAEIDGHVLRCRSRMTMWTPRGEIEGGIDTDDHGPAFQIVHVNGAVPTVMMNTVVPIDEENSDVSFAYTVRKTGNVDETQGVGAAIIRDLEKQFDQDSVIWENKAYHQRPMLCDGDGPITLYRKWMSQFFSQESA
jgi:phenylpropionate dioxygenase-like ring-hydroxylating dioxygenase large terminal subunit